MGLDGAGLRDAHAVGARRRSGAARAGARAGDARRRPRAGCPAAGSTSCSWTPRRGAVARADPRPRQGRGAGLDAGRRARRLPLRPRRRLEPLRAAPGRRGACCASPTCWAAPSRPTSARTAAPSRSPTTARGLRRARDRAARPRAGRPGRRLRGPLSARPRPDPAPADASPPALPRRCAACWPRFWAPCARAGRREIASGAATGGSGPAVPPRLGPRTSYGTGTRDASTGPAASTSTTASGPRSWSRRPGQDRASRADGRPHTRELTLRASLPVRRDAALARRGVPGLARASREDDPRRHDPEPALDLGGLEAAWTLSRAQQYPYLDLAGGRRAAARRVPQGGRGARQRRLARARRRPTRAPTCGSSARRDALAVRAGRRHDLRAAAVPALVRGRRLPGRQPVRRRARPTTRSCAATPTTPSRPALRRRQRRVPLSARSRSAAAVAAACSCATCAAACSSTRRHAWTGAFEAGDVKTAAGASLGLDSALGFALPLRAELALAHGFQDQGDTRVYLKFGLAF